MAGDTTQLMAREGQYIDISELPTNMIDLQNMILKAKGEFDKLDAETRKKFENSARKMLIFMFESIILSLHGAKW